MRRIVAAIVAAGLVPGFAIAQVSPTEAPPPRTLLAQVDDSDLGEEITLDELKEEEFDKDAQSMGAAIGLSLIPGGGWGLMYADKGAQSTVPLVLFVAGAVVGGLYVGGVFDESSKTVCQHTRDGRVPIDECGIGGTAGANQETDPRDPQMRPYFATQDDYERITVGEDFDGTDTGIIILGATYVATSILGAVWAGLVVSEHNERLRKDIDSTVQRQPSVRPTLAFSDEGGFAGFAIDF
jgi:hypothetical protein